MDSLVSRPLYSLFTQHMPHQRRQRHTRSYPLYLCAQLFKHLDFFYRHIVGHDDAAFVAPAYQRAIRLIMMSIRAGCQNNTHLARPTVAREIPVLPTVPSKRTEPVCGCSRPSASASSMTKSQHLPMDHMSIGRPDVLCKATRSLTDPPGLRNWHEWV